MTKIGINATAAFKKRRTGVEEYVYRLLEAVVRLKEAEKQEFVLYKDRRDQSELGFVLPKNFTTKEMYSPVAWTQTRLAAEMVFNRPDVLFIPVHILPPAHPENSIVTIHGLEYEYFPEYYSKLFLRYVRWSTKYAAKHARRIIAVSEATKNDLVSLYGAKPEKIEVIHHGFLNREAGAGSQNKAQNQKPFLLYLGRIELKKNILGILEAYQILKNRHQISHELILAGSPGFGYEKIKNKISQMAGLKSQIKNLGHVDEQTKWQLLANADAFLFPSFYEGFGLPILEAQSVGTPVIAGNISSMPEIAGAGAILVNPRSPEEIAAGIYRVLNRKEERKLLIERGFANLKRFSWGKCAKETLDVLIDSRP